MNPRIRIAATRTPDGGEMVLYQHDRDFSIMINGQDLMHSRQHESELDLARLGCSHLAGRKAYSSAAWVWAIPCARLSICSAPTPRW